MDDRTMWRGWDFWNPVKELLPDEPKKNRKITISTTCMGRAYDLKKTLLKNIVDNQDYPNVEFLILNYNGKDDLDEWMKRYISPWIEDGTVNYYKTTEPKHYEMGHSRNVCYRLAQGEIVNNVDADNYTGEGFASAINKLAELQPKNAVFTKGKRMMHGRVGMYKDVFEKVGGYDEDLTGYGYDDHWLQIRAMEVGCKMMWWGGVTDQHGERGMFSHRIKTPRGIVGENMKNKKWRQTEEINKKIAHEKYDKKEFVVNKDRHWGKAEVVKNFGEKTLKV